MAKRVSPLAFVLAVVLTNGCMHLGPKSPFATVTSIEGYERAMWDEVKAANWTAVNAHLAETFVQSGPEGARDRERALQHYQQMRLTAYQMSDVQTRPNGADMVVTYTLVLTGTADGQPIPAAPVRVMTVWQTVKHGWVEIAQSVTPAGP